jgi:hypothetical protein
MQIAFSAGGRLPTTAGEEQRDEKRPVMVLNHIVVSSAEKPIDAAAWVSWSTNQPCSKVVRSMYLNRGQKILGGGNRGNELVHFVHTGVSLVCREIGIDSLFGTVQEKTKVLPDMGDEQAGQV